MSSGARSLRSPYVELLEDDAAASLPPTGLTLFVVAMILGIAPDC